MTSQLSCVKGVNNPSILGNQWCDSPWTLVTKTINAMKILHPDVDFLLWTGDTVAHISNDKMNVTINMDVMANLTKAMNDTFPDKKVYATFGNHDYYPASQFPAVSNIIYNETAELWKQWIEDEEQLTNFRRGGYYTRLLPPHNKVRIVALNTNLYYTSDKITVNETDPTGQLQWMRLVLQLAKSNSEKVILAAHIPPGIHTPRGVQWFQDKFVQPFNSIVKDFADVIKAMHFGHDHYDGFKVFDDNSGKPAIPLFVAPSVTPWRFILNEEVTGSPHNPAIRLVTYDRDTGDHVNIDQYRMDLSASLPQGDGDFTRLYSFTESYKLQDISATSLDSLITRMSAQAGGDDLLNTYFNFTLTGAQFESCDQTCKTRILCGFRHYTSAEFNKCERDNSDASGTGSRVAAPTLLIFLVALLSLLR
ncbi:acid sphingomyelinase-like phosphodiesterase 3b isoform X2 [Littorina saxatilis]